MSQWILKPKSQLIKELIAEYRSLFSLGHSEITSPRMAELDRRISSLSQSLKQDTVKLPKREEDQRLTRW